MKRIDPAATFDEQHFSVPDLAKKWRISAASVRTLLKNNPDVPVRYLPPTKTKGGKEIHRRPLIPESSVKELYLRLPRSA
jgi:hypothetical protein